MSMKKSVYLSDRTLEVFGVREDEETLSGRLNAVIDRYGDLIARARRQVLLKLTAEELEILRCVALVWDSRKLPAPALVGALADVVVDYCLASGGSPAETPGAVGLIDKLGALPAAEQLALVEWMERDGAGAAASKAAA